jgi:hypothetical protein
MFSESMWQATQSDTSQDMTEALQQDFSYSVCYEPCDLLQYLPDQQGTQLPINSIYNSSGVVALPDWEISEQNDLLNFPSISNSSLLQMQQPVEGQDVLVQPSSEERELKQMVLGLQHRTEKLEELFRNFQNE